ncbi:MAG TPA: hypothetical protein DEH02_04675 [Bacteroidales bacterium]|nr:hypothetical protein [Bacteroidales bacterium]
MRCIEQSRNDCFQFESNAAIGHYGQTLINSEEACPKKRNPCIFDSARVSFVGPPGHDPGTP